MQTGDPRSIVAALALAIVAGCSSGGSSGSRDATQVASDVLQQQLAQHGANASVTTQWAGYWRGTLAIGARWMEVEAVATGNGLAIIAPLGGGPAFLVTRLSVTAGHFRGEIADSSSGLAVVLALDGEAETGRFDALVLPQNWSRADYDANRIPTAAELAQIGYLKLERREPALPLSLVAGEINLAAGVFRVDGAGNVLLSTPSCSGMGGIALSPSAGGVLELAIETTGAGCPLQGTLTGSIHSNAAGEATVLLTDGSRTLAVTLPWVSLSNQNDS